VEGETSDNRSYIDLKKAASSFSSGSYTEVKGAGHLVPMEKPKEVIEIFKNFFLQ
jgi:pimeloyl-ACP methyl ester carboxylesterase